MINLPKITTPKMKNIFSLRMALMLPQSELAQHLGVYQSRISEAERGENPDFEAELLEILKNPTEMLLSRLILLAKFRRLVDDLTDGNQSEFAVLANMSQGAVSVFYRAKKKLLVSRWAEILENLGIDEPETTETDIATAGELFNRLREDEGFQLQSLLKERRVKLGNFAQKCGVSQSTVSMWFGSERFHADVKRKVDRAL